MRGARRLVLADGFAAVLAMILLASGGVANATFKDGGQVPKSASVAPQKATIVNFGAHKAITST